MIGKVKDVIEPDGEETAVVMIEIPKKQSAKMWKMVGKEVVIAWVN